MALVASGADPNMPLDEQNNTLLHQAESPEEITVLLESPLINVNVTNKVGSSIVDVLRTHRIYY